MLRTRTTPPTTTLLLCCVAALLMAVTLTGCGDPASAQAGTSDTPTKMSVTVINQTRGDLEGVVVKASLHVAFSELERGERHTMSHRDLELTEKVKVRWVEARRGEVHHLTLYPFRTLGRHYRGSIEVTLRPNGEARLRKAN